MSIRKRRGFTLVELLVVISIIGMLAALLLPAINSAREAGRRTTCTNNQKQLAIAFQRYEQSRNGLPGYANIQATSLYWDTDGDGFLDAQFAGAGIQRASACTWMFPLLPFLDRNDIYQAYGPAAQDVSGNVSRKGERPYLTLPVVVCPSDAKASTVTVVNDVTGSTSAPPSPLSYVVNCGMPDIGRNFGAIVNVPGANVGGNTATGPAQSTDNAANGVFFDLYPDFDSNVGTDGNGGRVKKVTMTYSYISSGDGLSSTLLCTENTDSGNWNESHFAMQTGYNVMERKVGFVWWPLVDANGVATTPDVLTGSATLVCRINQGSGTGPTNETPGDPSAVYDNLNNWYARPASFHPGAVVATFCDSHITALSDDTDLLVYTLLMTPRGKDSAIVNVNMTTPTLTTGPSPAIFRTTPLDEGSLQ